MEAAWAVVAAVSARAEKCVSPFSHYKPTADLTPFHPFHLGVAMFHEFWARRQASYPLGARRQRVVFSFPFLENIVVRAGKEVVL